MPDNSDQWLYRRAPPHSPPIWYEQAHGCSCPGHHMLLSPWPTQHWLEHEHVEFYYTCHHELKTHHSAQGRAFQASERCSPKSWESNPQNFNEMLGPLAELRSVYDKKNLVTSELYSIDYAIFLQSATT